MHDNSQRWIQDTPVGEGANPSGTPAYGFANFFKELHGIEKFLDPGEGAHAEEPRLDTPLISVDLGGAYHILLSDVSVHVRTYHMHDGIGHMVGATPWPLLWTHPLGPFFLQG